MKLPLCSTALFSVLLISSLLSACGGGGNDSPAAGNNGGSCANLTGNWYVTEKQISSTCGTLPAPSQSRYTVTQNGCNATITDGTKSLTGTVGTNTVTFTGSFPAESSGTTTVTGMAMAISGDQNSMSGTSSWTWGDNTSSCGGKTDVTGTRVTPASVNVSGLWNGNWDAGSGMTGTFSANVVQRQDATLTGTMNVPTAGLANAALAGVVSGDQMTIGDIGKEITFTGKVSGGSSASGTFDYPSMLISGTWTGSK